MFDGRGQLFTADARLPDFEAGETHSATMLLARQYFRIPSAPPESGRSPVRSLTAIQAFFVIPEAIVGIGSEPTAVYWGQVHPNGDSETGIAI